uniref:Bublin coiled coil protein n=1 Tax=Oncorhynchus kisutch TaxID=8019 RepID=A0A8C7G5H5_ONCKI
MSGPNGDPNISTDDDVITEPSTLLDQINSCLDDLEERNDSLNDQLHELLESNWQAWQEFRVQLSTATPPGEDQQSPDKDSPASEGRRG